MGDRIREARHHAKLTQTQLGERLGVSYQQLQKYENGSNTLSSVMLIAMSKALNKPPAFFLPGVAANGRENPSVAKLLSLPETYSLAQYFPRMPQRDRVLIIDMARALVEAREGA